MLNVVVCCYSLCDGAMLGMEILNDYLQSLEHWLLSDHDLFFIFGNGHDEYNFRDPK